MASTSVGYSWLIICVPKEERPPPISSGQDLCVAVGPAWENPGIAVETKITASDSLTNCLKTMPHLLLKKHNFTQFSITCDVSNNVQDVFSLRKNLLASFFWLNINWEKTAAPPGK
jgi:hypothetical protein